jgi:hypothetical protein
MPPALPPLLRDTVKPSIPTGSCRGVEVFAAGEHKGRAYTVRDLDDMVANFRRFSAGRRALVEPPVVIGHQDDHVKLSDGLDDAWRTNTGWPSFGRVRDLYRRGATLFADLDRVPRSIADLVNARLYHKVSSEVYDDPPPGCFGGRGNMLRRVAFLGGEIPVVKGLADIPAIVFSESAPPPARRRPAELRLARVTRRVVAPPGGRAGARAGSRFRVFSEVTLEASPMQRENMQKLLCDGYGYEPDTFADAKVFPDEALEALIMQEAGLHGGDSGTSETETPDGAGPPVDEAGGAGDAADPGAPADPAAMSREELISALTDAGEDPATLQDLTDDQLREKYMSTLGNMSERGGGAGSGSGGAGSGGSDTTRRTPATLLRPAVPRPEATPAAVFSESRRILAEVTRVRQQTAADLAQIRRERESSVAMERKRQTAEKAALVHAFCETLVKEGRLTSAEAFDRSNPAVPCQEELLMARDANTVVRTFSENGKEVKQTDLEAAMAALKARRPEMRRFSEQLTAGAEGGPNGKVVTPERKKELLMLTDRGRDAYAKRYAGKN